MMSYLQSIYQESSMRRHLFLLYFVAVSIFLPFQGEAAKYPDLTPRLVREKFNEIMKSHASYHELTPEIAKRAMQNFLEELDPTKTYLIGSDIEVWVNPSDELLNKVISDYNKNNFSTFEEMQNVMVKAIQRHHELAKEIHNEDLPKRVNPEEFKDMKWAETPQELLSRMEKIKGLRVESSAKMNEELKEKALLRLAKAESQFEEEILTPDPKKREQILLTKVLKAFASALDTHTSYFTPEEATQFVIDVQQRLFGIGAQLRDDINGFTVVKIVKGGPAYESKELKINDRIIAVNGEPVVGMDIRDAVSLIRGEANTPVTLKVIREVKEGDKTSEETLDITLMRGEVVLKESRYESSYEPYGDGVIAYIRLFSFYQDPDHSSATDIEQELEKIKKDHKVLGVVLDLRSNSGGILAQAVAVTGLFITKGVVVSIKDETGEVQHLRDVDAKTIWNGPLIVLTNRLTASASEIVAQALQDYGRAIVVGDDHSFGKGSYQTFTLNLDKATVHPLGEYKVTRGRYYTVSGKSPQLVGVSADIDVPGPLFESEIGERFAKYPLDTDKIKENFEDDLTDVPLYQREKIASLYKFNLQPRLHVYEKYLSLLKKNSEERVANSKNYQNFLKEVKKKDKSIEEEEEPTYPFGQNDLQLNETYNIMQDLIYLMITKNITAP